MENCDKLIKINKEIKYYWLFLKINIELKPKKIFIKGQGKMEKILEKLGNFAIGKK